MNTTQFEAILKAIPTASGSYYGTDLKMPMYLVKDSFEGNIQVFEYEGSIDPSFNVEGFEISYYLEIETKVASNMEIDPQDYMENENTEVLQEYVEIHYGNAPVELTAEQETKIIETIKNRITAEC